MTEPIDIIIASSQGLEKIGEMTPITETDDIHTIHIVKCDDDKPRTWEVTRVIDGYKVMMYVRQKVLTQILLKNFRIITLIKVLFNL